MGAAHRSCVRALVLAGTISAIVTLALPGCQFPDYGMANSGSAGAAAEDSGAADGGEAGGAAGNEDGGAAGAEPCAVEDCVPEAPSGWTGPIAFWDDIAGVLDPLPDCPEGYAKPNDLHHGIEMPTSGCQCTCTAQDQVCSSALNIYDDQACESAPCATVSPLTCDAVSSCIHSRGTLKAAIPTLSGGSCKAAVGPKAAASWQYDSRICSPRGVCEDRSQVCAPVPGAPYAPKLCVMSQIPENQPLPECPAEYPNESEPLYKAFTDSRRCSECVCSGVTGGACSGMFRVSAEADCSGGVEYKTGSGCQPLTLVGNNAHPTSIGTEYMLTPGSCKVVTPSSTTGSARTLGSAIVVCCQ